ncbi:hypothetical protein MRB53_001105 [Persea americana]|uniref:Uncharacterized protein n=1 Tax=Persea americana TaxID=3435 RepID=A0ACC2MQR4_PERAE|nr:hypothetical protein MRB53_001105 [Persea americana]
MSTAEDPVSTTNPCARAQDFRDSPVLSSTRRAAGQRSALFTCPSTYATRRFKHFSAEFYADTKFRYHTTGQTVQRGKFIIQVSSIICGAHFVTVKTNLQVAIKRGSCSRYIPFPLSSVRTAL